MEGRRPLHMACMHGHVETARLLLAAGADATDDVRDVRGASPLQLAEQAGHVAVARLLKKRRRFRKSRS